MTHINELNISDLSCAWRILRIRDALKPLGIGERLKVIANDPAFIVDLNAYLRQSKHVLIDHSQMSSNYVFIIEKHQIDASQ